MLLVMKSLVPTEEVIWNQLLRANILVSLHSLLNKLKELLLSNQQQGMGNTFLQLSQLQGHLRVQTIS